MFCILVSSALFKFYLIVQIPMKFTFQIPYHDRINCHLKFPLFQISVSTLYSSKMANLVLTSLSTSNRIRKELTRGVDYRTIKSKADLKPLNPVRSPVDVTFFVHRKRHVKRVVEEIETPVTAPYHRLKTKAGGKSKSVPHIKNSFWERAKLTHKQYLDVLSTPHLQSKWLIFFKTTLFEF